MRALLVAGCAMALAVSPMSVAAQEAEDDWEFAEDTAQGFSAAITRYDSGQALVVQCRGRELRVVIAGLPATIVTSRVLLAARADGRSDRQVWAVEAGPNGATSVLTSTVPGRDARFLRGGGVLTLRSAAGQASPMRVGFDLPTQNASVDKVLAACGEPVEEPRDLLPRAPDDLTYALLETDSEGRTPSTPDSPPTRVIRMSCIVHTGRFADCRADFQAPSNSAQYVVEGMNGREVRTADLAAAEGSVFYTTDLYYGELLQVVRR